MLKHAEIFTGEQYRKMAARQIEIERLDERLLDEGAYTFNAEATERAGRLRREWLELEYLQKRITGALFMQTVTLRKSGDFYTAYDDDAWTVASALGLVVTKEKHGTQPMCHIPAHAIQQQLSNLDAAGIAAVAVDQ